MSRARELSKLGNNTTFAVDTTNSEVGIASTVPSSTLDVRGEVKVGTAVQLGSAGVVTATSFSGSGANLTGLATTETVRADTLTVAGVSTLTGAVNVDATTDSTSTSTGALIVDGGVGIAKNVYIGAGLSVAGTLTYEDVTNVDSVGLITAKSGVNVTGGQLAVGVAYSVGAAGVATAAGFVGPLTGNVTGNASGTAGGLTGTPNISCGTIAGSTGSFTGDVDIADKIVHTGDTNTAIRFPSADTITAETAGSEAFRITSNGSVGINSTSPSSNEKLCIRGGASDSGKFTFHSYADFLGASDAYLGHSIIARGAKASNSGSQWTGIGATTSYGWINFAANSASQISITSSKIGIGTIDPQRAIHISTNNTVVALTDTGASSDEKTKYILSDAGILGIGKLNDAYDTATEHLRLDNSGRLLLGTTTEGSANADELTINTASGHGGITIRNDSSSNGNIYFSDGTSGAAEYAGYLQYDHSSNAFRFGSDGDLSLTLDSSHNATFAGSVSDSKGDVRQIIYQNKTSGYTLVASDAGKAIHISTGGVTINDSLFSAGDAVTIINNSGSSQTITQGSGVTLYNTADATTGNKTLTTRGIATVWFSSASIGYITGNFG